MVELQGKKRRQPSSCPEGWLPAAVVVQLELTRRQERYAQRCVGIARFVYNRMVANDQAGRDAGLSGIACIRYDGHRRIRLPYLGSVKMTRALPDGIPYEVIIRKRNGRWWASIAYWKPPVAAPQRETQSVGGVDVGINPLAVGSDHVRYENPKALENALRRLRRWQRAQARRTQGSRGWWAAQRRIDRANGLRDNAHHQVSRTLVGKYHTIGIESLNVAGMIRAGLQSKALSDAGMSSLLNQIRYKADWHGTDIVEADRWYPSSRTCSVCGVVNPALGREPKWSCPSCGVIHPPQADNENAARPPEAEVNLRYSR